ncbi:carbohydrate phosphorylase family protein, partial [Chlamydia psittaci 02DC14]
RTFPECYTLMILFLRGKSCG